MLTVKYQDVIKLLKWQDVCRSITRVFEPVISNIQAAFMHSLYLTNHNLPILDQVNDMDRFLKRSVPGDTSQEAHK